MNSHINASQFAQFRTQVYQSINKRADSVMGLLDALCSTPNARSVVELSLSPHFKHQYSSLYKAIAEVDWTKLDLATLVGPYLARPSKRRYWLIGMDGTPQKRQFASTLSDRGYIYYPNPVGRNKPIAIGHEYSTVALLPELGPQMAPSWVTPLATQRIRTTDDKELVGATQVNTLLANPQMPWDGDLVVAVGDSRYSKPAYLHAVHQDQANLVTVVKVRGDRTFYHYIAHRSKGPFSNCPSLGQHLHRAALAFGKV